jgi:ABC-type sulfate transport system permease component
MPLAVYIALQQDPEVAVVMSLLLIAVAIALLAAFPFATIATTPRPPRAAG